MSHHDTSQIAPSPNRTKGCQDLLVDGACVHSGWLRRQSLRNKLKIFAWPQVYVAISGGCVYCYSNEMARRPASAFSLYGYDKVYRAGEVTEKEATWTFKLVHVNPDYRSYLFSASSEKEMASWMAMLKQEMLRASGKLHRTQGDGGNCEAVTYQDAASNVTSEEDYMDIEASIYEDSRLCVLPKNYDNKKENDDSDDEMDRVVMTRPDLQERPPQPPPVPVRPTRKQRGGGDGAAQAAVMEELAKMVVEDSGKQRKTSGSEVLRPAKEPDRPNVDRSSKPIRARGAPEGSSGKKVEEEQTDDQDFWSSIFFYGDRDQAQEIISHIADDGVYLVRVNADKSMVLHVYAKDQARKFHIFKEDKQYSLDKSGKDKFRHVEELIYFYYDNPLPRNTFSLSECYIHHPYYHSLHWT